MKLEPIKNSDICEKEKTPILYKHTHTHIYIYMGFMKMEIMTTPEATKETQM